MWVKPGNARQGHQTAQIHVQTVAPVPQGGADGMGWLPPTPATWVDYIDDAFGCLIGTTVVFGLTLVMLMAGVRLGGMPTPSL